MAVRPPRSPRPLDVAALETLALRYVERFATTRGKLADYLRRKVRERGWEGPAADPLAIAERMAAAGFVDDRAFAEARARSLGRRGYGTRRVGQALSVAHVEPADAVEALETGAQNAFATALAFAKRRRIGPFAAAPAEEKIRARHLAALLRAGHDYRLARRILDAAPGEELTPED